MSTGWVISGLTLAVLGLVVWDTLVEERRVTRETIIEHDDEIGEVTLYRRKSGSNDPWKKL